MTEHLDKNKIINKNYFCIQKQKNCFDSIIALTKWIKSELDKKKIVYFVWLEKAIAKNFYFFLKIEKKGLWRIGDFYPVRF